MAKVYGIHPGNYQPKADNDFDWVYVSRVFRRGKWYVEYITQGGHGETKEMKARTFRERYFRSNGYN